MLVAVRERLIEWGDCDPAGIVFNPRFFEWFDAATAGLFREAGFEKADFAVKFDAVGFPIVESRASFHVACRFGETVRIETCAPKLGTRSFDIRHQLRKGETLCVEAFETRVWVGRDPDDPAKLKAKPLPEEIVAALQG